MNCPAYLREDIEQESRFAQWRAGLTYDSTRSGMTSAQYGRVKAKQSKVDFLRRWFGRLSNRPRLVSLDCVSLSTRPAPLPEPRLMREVDALPAPERDVILLFYWFGCTHAEIADHIGLSKTYKVETAMTSAIKTLREKLT